MLITTTDHRRHQAGDELEFLIEDNILEGRREGRPIGATHFTRTLEEALSDSPGDLACPMYLVHQGQPLTANLRIAQSNLGDLLSLGIDAMADSIWFDFDLHHQPRFEQRHRNEEGKLAWNLHPNDSEMIKFWDELQHFSSPLGTPCVVYTTDHGARMVFALPQSCRAVQLQGLRLALSRSLRDANLIDDSGAAAINNYYRLPFGDHEVIWRPDDVLDEEAGRFISQLRGDEEELQQLISLNRSDLSIGIQEARDLITDPKASDNLTEEGRAIASALMGAQLVDAGIAAGLILQRKARLKPENRANQLKEAARVVASTCAPLPFWSVDYLFGVLVTFVDTLDDPYDGTGPSMFDQASSLSTWAYPIWQASHEHQVIAREKQQKAQREQAKEIARKQIKSTEGEYSGLQRTSFYQEPPSTEFLPDITDKGNPVTRSFANMRWIFAQFGVQVYQHELHGFPIVRMNETELAIEEAVPVLYAELESDGRLVGPNGPPTLRLIETLLRRMAVELTYCPIRDYLSNLRHDGTARVREFLKVYFNAEPHGEKGELILEEWSEQFLMRAAARILYPGTKADEILIIHGPQGIRKSEAVKALVPNPEWYGAGLPNDIRSAKEVMEKTQGLWIIEADEFKQIRKSQVSEWKAFLSRQVDQARKAYGRNTSKIPRRFTYIATTNEIALFTDSTGDRRFWPVETEYIDIDAIHRDRDQLWAEARDLVLEKGRMDAHGKFVIDPIRSELWTYQRAFQTEFLSVTGDATLLEQYLPFDRSLHMRIMPEHVRRLFEECKLDKLRPKEMAELMREFGFEIRQTSYQNTDMAKPGVRRYYVRGARREVIPTMQIIGGKWRAVRDRTSQDWFEGTAKKVEKRLNDYVTERRGKSAPKFKKKDIPDAV